MGYRSEVYIGVAFQSEADLKEVLAVYAIDSRVQQYNIVPDWEVKEDNILFYSCEDIKWYDSYAEVQGYEYLLTLADKFNEERGMAIEYRFIRLGEDHDDTEIREECTDGKLWEAMQVVRTVEINL